jgi:uncharacterized protein YndB with AHSA1/START domain
MSEHKSADVPTQPATPAPKRASIFKTVLLVFATIVAVFLGVVALQPSEFRITRSTTIAAPAEEVFEQVNDFHNWEAWSPWAKLDPAAKSTIEGPPSGTGAVFKWSGNEQIGEGTMTLTKSRPNELIWVKLEFAKPFAATSTADFTFEPQGENTVVTWGMSGHNDFLGKAICLFMNMDKTVGGQFEQGLASIKSVVEGAHK